MIPILNHLDTHRLGVQMLLRNFAAVNNKSL